MPDPLQELRDAAPANGDFLDDLERRLTSAHPIPVVPFVGAGLSIPMGFPSWTTFLTRLAAECGASAAVAALLSANQYEEAAEAVESAMGPVIFHRRVSQTYGQAKSYGCELRGAVRVLPELAPGPVATTNFDRLIERAFEEAGTAFEHVAWGSQVDQMRRATIENRPFLLKLHGDGEERSGRVLTKSEYDRQYGGNDPDGLRAQLKRAFQGRTFLFVGCSLGADRTLEVLRDLVGESSGLEHLALVERPAEDAAFFAKQRFLGERGILPVWYPTGRHDLVEPFLRWIARLQPSTRVAEAQLVLETPAQRKHAIRGELDLLIPYQRITELKGRERDLDDLRRWVDSDRAASVCVITGGGGSGKTRLAIELLEQVEAEAPGQWRLGFLTSAEMERFSKLQNLAEWRRRKPVLAVVDYAAGSAGLLRMWLDQLVAAAPDGEKLRLLLLEREASFEAGWLASAVSMGHAGTAVRALFDPPEPVRLATIADAMDRRSVLSAALRRRRNGRRPPCQDCPRWVRTWSSSDGWLSRCGAIR